jgi:hypothetical protein
MRKSAQAQVHGLRTIALFAALLLILAGAATAQILYGALTGNVADPTGAVLPKARVEALNVATGIVRSADVDASGTYYFAELQPGVYTVTVSASGFAKASFENVRVDANNVRRVDARLKVASATQEVTVTALAPLMQTDRADVHTNIDAQEIQSLPISSSEGRSWQALYNIIPGATPTAEANSQAGNPQRAMNTNVNGGSMQNNNTRIDGAQNAYPWLPANIAYVPPADAVDTINVVTNSFDAEQGMAGGMAVNVQIKSGTNQFHGSAHEFHTDTSLRAENYFQVQTVQDPVTKALVPFKKPKDIQNQFGYTFGGPIKKDKLFFFTDFERTTERKLATVLTTVPTDAERGGDFSGLLSPGVNCTNITGAFTDPTRATSSCIYDPRTGAANGTGRAPFLNNKIPSGLIDPAAATMLQLIPEPNIPNQETQNYFASGNAQFNREDLDAKINYVPSPKSTVFGRYSLSQSYIFDPPALGKAEGDATNGGQLGNAYSRIQNVGLGGTYSITATMLADANLGFTRQRINAQALDIGSNFGLDTLHIPGTNGTDPLQAGIPAFQITGYANLGNPNTGNPFLFRDNQWVSNANLNWTHGRHGLRFGVEFNRSGINHFQPQGGAFQTARGSFQFNGGPTAVTSGDPQCSTPQKTNPGHLPCAPASSQFNSIAEFLLGLPSRAGEAIQNQNPNSLRWSQWALYARDQWQMLPRLTVTYGLRWERYPFVTSDHGGARLLDPTTMNVLIGGHSGVPMDDGVSIGAGQFLPRLGLAWRPLEKTVVRAGYGMSADPNNWRFFRNAFPVVTISDFNAANGFAPAVSLTGTNATLAPFGTVPTGIPAIPKPDLSAGVVPLPDGVGTTTAAKDFRRGYTHSFNLTIGQEFAGFVADVGYVGSRSIRPLSNVNINPGPLGGFNGSSQDGRILNQQFGHLTTITNPATGRHYSGWGDINELMPFGNAYYDSLQAKVIRKLKGSSLVGLSYTWSKAIDFTDNEELNFLLFPFPAYSAKARGLASYDRPHNLRFYGVYELPFGRGQRWVQTGIWSKIAGGWQTNWILSKVSGVPFTITAGNPGFNAAGNTETANQSGPVNIIGATPRPNCKTGDLTCSYFDPSVFSAPSGPIFGNVGRDTVRGPGFFNLDMSVFRTFKLTERFSLQCRGEAFGLTNTPHFNNPGAGFAGTGVGTFGVITSTRPGDPGSRTVWLAAKVIF